MIPRYAKRPFPGEKTAQMKSFYSKRTSTFHPKPSCCRATRTGSRVLPDKIVPSHGGACEMAVKHFQIYFMKRLRFDL